MLTSKFRSIVSLANPIIKDMIKVRENRATRTATKSVLVCGSTVCKEIADSCNPSVVLRAFVTDEARAPAGVEAKNVFVITPEVMRKLTDMAHPPDFAAQLALPATFHDVQADRSTLVAPTHRFILALSAINDPGNLGLVD
jgi:tRNA G18 (ribose-2'-O)-methylase SpoU